MSANKAWMSGKLAKIRALAVLQRKITGQTNKALAKEFNVSIDTIEACLKMAVNDDLIAQYEAQLLGELVPVAIQAVKRAMEDNDAQVALDILKGAGILKKQTERVAPLKEGEETLEVYASKRTHRLPANGPLGLPPLSAEDAAGGFALPALAEHSESLQPVDGPNRLPQLPTHSDLALGLLEGELAGELGEA